MIILNNNMIIYKSEYTLYIPIPISNKNMIFNRKYFYDF